MVLDPAGPITHRRLIHRRRPTAAAHRCVHRSVQRDCRAIRLDQEKGLPATVQKSPYHSTLIPSTSLEWPTALQAEKLAEAHAGVSTKEAAYQSALRAAQQKAAATLAATPDNERASF